MLGFKFDDALGYKLDASAFSQAIKLEGGAGPTRSSGASSQTSSSAAADRFGRAAARTRTRSGAGGSDLLGGGTGIDTLIEIGDVSFKLTNTLLTGLGQDVLSGFEAATLSGGDHDNVLDASAFKAGPVTLFGLGADDVLLATGLGRSALRRRRTTTSCGEERQRQAVRRARRRRSRRWRRNGFRRRRPRRRHVQVDRDAVNC